MINIALTPRGRAFGLAFALGAGAAGAAEMPRAAQLAAFEDWRLDCAAAPCRIHTSVAGADGAELLRLEAAEDALALRTPLPLLLPEGVTLAPGAQAPRALDWRTCDAAGCVAEAPLDPDLLEALRREREASVTLTLLDGVRVRLPVSLLGFAAAWRAREGASVSP